MKMKKSSLSGVELTVGGLVAVEEVIVREMGINARKDEFFEDLGEKRQVWYRSIIGEIVNVERRIFEEWCDESMLEGGRKNASRKREIDNTSNRSNKTG
jgi:hypothetical protein